MPEFMVTGHAVEANAVLIGVMAIAHVGTMIMLGGVVWWATRYREALADPYLEATPPEPSPPT